MINFLKSHYEVVEKTSTLFKIKIESQMLQDTLQFLGHNSFITLSQISCTDWIEDGIFTLHYILTTEGKNCNLMVSLDINRTNDTLPTLMEIFPQSEIMERDLHEMFGIKFIGNPTLHDFALENWNSIPPLRREFDTLAFVQEHFEFKKGREDNKDVKEEAKRRREEAKKQKEAENGA